MLAVVRGEAGDERFLMFGQVLPSFTAATTLGTEVIQSGLVASQWDGNESGNGTGDPDPPLVGNVKGPMQ